LAQPGLEGREAGSVEIEEGARQRQLDVLPEHRLLPTLASSKRRSRLSVQRLHTQPESTQPGIDLPERVDLPLIRRAVLKQLALVDKLANRNGAESV
jgi:hypothetical protein